MIIQTNIPALYALREKRNTDNAIAKNLQKLSSGFRIQQAADDAAGLAVSEKCALRLPSWNDVNSTFPKESILRRPRMVHWMR